MLVQFRKDGYAANASLGVDAEDLQDAFEFGVAVEGNIQRAFALGVTQ